MAKELMEGAVDTSTGMAAKFETGKANIPTKLLQMVQGAISSATANINQVYCECCNNDPCIRRQWQ